MKILMTTDAVGGVWTYAIELCRALAAFEVDVVLAAMGPLPTDAQRAMAAKLANVQLVGASWKLEWMAHPWEDVERAGEWLLDCADRERVDLIHLNGYAHAPLSWSRPVVVVAHSCVCTWWQAVHGEAAPAGWNRYRQTVSAGLAAASLVVAPTRAFLDMLEAEYGTLARTAVVHNARSDEPIPDRERLPEIFACGRVWDEAKNLRVLDVAARGLPWKVYVAGESTSPEGRACDTLDLECLGRLSEAEVQDRLSRASIFAHPALYEPFGLAVLEAARRGCALVLSDVPTLRELWEGAALFASPRDPSEFHAQLTRLIESPQERHILGAAARARAEAFDVVSMASAYHASYTELIRTHAAKERAVA